MILIPMMKMPMMREMRGTKKTTPAKETKPTRATETILISAESSPKTR